MEYILNGIIGGYYKNNRVNLREIWNRIIGKNFRIFSSGVSSTKHVRLLPGTSTARIDEDQSSNADTVSESPELGIFWSQMNPR